MNIPGHFPTNFPKVPFHFPEFPSLTDNSEKSRRVRSARASIVHATLVQSVVLLGQARQLQQRGLDAQIKRGSIRTFEHFKTELIRTFQNSQKDTKTLNFSQNSPNFQCSRELLDLSLPSHEELGGKVLGSFQWVSS